jgi:hypothetical protein
MERCWEGCGQVRRLIRQAAQAAESSQRLLWRSERLLDQLRPAPATLDDQIAALQKENASLRQRLEGQDEAGTVGADADMAADEAPGNLAFPATRLAAALLQRMTGDRCEAVFYGHRYRLERRDAAGKHSFDDEWMAQYERAMNSGDYPNLIISPVISSCMNESFCGAVENGCGKRNAV